MKPKALNPGDTIRIVAPSSPLPDKELDACIAKLTAWGFKVELASSVHEHWRYLAANDAARAKDITDAFLDPNVHAVLCARGGYGCARLLGLLDIATLAKHPKLLIGFSDITTLHLAFNAAGMPTVHGIMGSYFAKEREPWVLDSFYHVITGSDPIIDGSPRAQCLVPGTSQGRLLGGCLTLIGDAQGTKHVPDFKGAILLIEDVGEKGYRVDARLTQLRNTGVLHQVAGIVIGEMTDTDTMRDKDAPEVTWKEIVQERLDGIRVPTMWDFPIGHIKNPLSLPLGIRVEMDAEAGSLRYLESVCD